MIISNRRQLITGLISFIAAPAIVRASSLMPVKAFVLPDHRLMLADYIDNKADIDVAYGTLKLGDIVTFDDQSRQFVVTGNYEGGNLSIYPYGHFGEEVILEEVNLRCKDDNS